MPLGFGLGVEVLELSAILREEVDDPLWMERVCMVVDEEGGGLA